MLLELLEDAYGLGVVAAEFSIQLLHLLRIFTRELIGKETKSLKSL